MLVDFPLGTLGKPDDVGVSPTAAGVMLRMCGAVLLGMNPQRNRSTNPSGRYLLGLRTTTRRGAGIEASEVTRDASDRQSSRTAIRHPAGLYPAGLCSKFHAIHRCLGSHGIGTFASAEFSQHPRRIPMNPKRRSLTPSQRAEAARQRRPISGGEDSKTVNFPRRRCSSPWISIPAISGKRPGRSGVQAERLVVEDGATPIKMMDVGLLGAGNALHSFSTADSHPVLHRQLGDQVRQLESRLASDVTGFGDQGNALGQIALQAAFAIEPFVESPQLG